MLPAPGCSGRPLGSIPLPAADHYSISPDTLSASLGRRPSPSRSGRPTPAGSATPAGVQRGTGMPSLSLPAALLARGFPGPVTPPGSLLPAAASLGPAAAASAAGPAAGPRPPPRADWLAGIGGGAEWPGRFAGSGLQRLLAHRRERSRGARSPGTPAARQPERAARVAEGARAPPGDAALAAMCSQLWFLTDRRIREDYPQVQILRALRQRCSEQDVRFRAVLMDQIAVTIVGGNLGELGGPGRAGSAPGSPRASGWARAPGPPPPRAKSPSGPPNLPLSPERPLWVRESP